MNLLGGSSPSRVTPPPGTPGPRVEEDHGRGGQPHQQFLHCGEHTGLLKATQA